MAIKFPLVLLATLCLLCSCIGSQSQTQNLPQAQAQPQTQAQPQPQTKRQDIMKLLDLIDTKSRISDILDEYFEFLQEELDSIPPNFFEYVKTEIKLESLVEVCIPIYDEYFSNDEIEELIKFYENPTRENLLKGAFLMNKYGDSFTMELAEKLVKKINSIIHENEDKIKDFSFEDVGEAFTDARDGQTYKVAKIGNQTWMAENLNYDAEGSKCYNNKQENCAKYGRLYSWEMAARACPKGWKLPSDWEWQMLVKFAEDNERFISGEEVAGEKLKAKNGWKKNKDSKNGLDSHGFSALPGGYGTFSDGGFSGAGSFGMWWSTEINSEVAWSRTMHYTGKYVQRSRATKKGFLSLRCLRFSAEQQKNECDTTAFAGYGQLQDERDGTKYKTVQIGNQTWMAENLNYATEESKSFDRRLYGMLYDKETAMKICPSGWHLPSDKEWNALIANAGGQKIAGRKLKAKCGWAHYGDGTDDYGFSALPGGIAFSSGSFGTVGALGNWWSSAEDRNNNEWHWKMYAGDNVDRVRSGDNKKVFSLYSVRCVKD
jgi:uncharacterized protein (TIGR02145 family)